MSGNIRQELYDRIRESSKDEVILAEMIRLGYWPQNKDMPSAPEELIKRNGEISRALSALYTQQQKWANPERALKEMHKERKRAAMERRKETKLRNAHKRYERALAWAEKKKDEIAYLGDGVSAGLTHGRQARADMLPGLPVLPSAKALAAAMGVPLGELRFLSYERALSRVSHYQRFLLPKKAGGYRQISAPMPRLKAVQYWILDNILAKVPVHDAAHGFAVNRSILTNAAPHVGKDVVVNLDMKDFFPTLSWRRVRGKFLGLGYSESVATILALICTEPDIDEVELDGQRLYLRKGPRRLPQGAPTSPALTNLICSRLDKRLSGLAAKLGFTYTRYADDMTFSASGEAARMVGTLLKAVNDIVASEGFVVHPDKTRIMRKHRRQEVTGLVVNNGIGVPRDTLRRFRALLHQIEKTGPDGKNWGAGGNVLAAAQGFAHFVRMVDAEAGGPLVTKAEALARRHNLPGNEAQHPFRQRAAAGVQPLERWWKPAEPESPPLDPVLVMHQREQERDAQKLQKQQEQQQEQERARLAQEQAERERANSPQSRRGGFAAFVRRTEAAPESAVDIGLRAMFEAMRFDRVCTDSLASVEAHFAEKMSGDRLASLTAQFREELAWSRLEPLAIEAYKKHFSLDDVEAYRAVLRTPFGMAYSEFIPAYVHAFVQLNKVLDQRIDLIVDAIFDGTPLPDPLPVPAPADAHEQAVRAFVSMMTRAAYDAQMGGIESKWAAIERGQELLTALRKDIQFDAYVAILSTPLSRSLSEDNIAILHSDWNRPEWQVLLQKQRAADGDFQAAFQTAIQGTMPLIMSRLTDIASTQQHPTSSPTEEPPAPAVDAPHSEPVAAPQAAPVITPDVLPAPQPVAKPQRQSIFSIVARLFSRRSRK